MQKAVETRGVAEHEHRLDVPRHLRSNQRMKVGDEREAWTKRHTARKLCTPSRRSSHSRSSCFSLLQRPVSPSSP